MDVKELYSLVDKARKYDELIKPFKDKQLHCSFCGKSQDLVNTLMTGNGVYICNECVELTHGILVNNSKTEKEIPKNGSYSGDILLCGSKDEMEKHKTCIGCKYNKVNCTNTNLCIKDYYGYYSGYEEI